MGDMTTDVFAQHRYGRLALQKLSKTHPLSANFRLFYAGWLGEKPADWQVMELRGAEFRAPSRGPNKGKLSLKVAGTTRTIYVTREEIEAAQTAAETTS